MFITYVIKSENNKYYTGHTSDIERRLFEHNTGLTKSTKSDKGWLLIYSKEFETRSEAMKYEKWLKSGHGRSFLENIKKQIR